MACPDCFINCPDVISDKCTKYTGDPIPALDICTGDPLSKVQAAIIESLFTALDGTGIEPADVTLENCPWLIEMFGTKDPNLNNLLQLLIDANCSLKQLIDDLTPSSSVFDTACLEGLPANPTPSEVLQAAVLLLCSIKTTVDTFPTTYVKLTDLQNLVENIVGGGSTNYSTRLVPYVAVPYFGSLSNFDPTGKGIVASGFNKIYICNGSYGTPDMRGRVVVGAVRNVPGAVSLDAAVDPTNSNNPNTNYAAGDKFGESYHALISTENGPHTHGVNDPGHTHPFPGVVPDGRGSDGAKAATQSTLQTQSSQTGITIQSSGSGIAHENRQPSIAAVWIMFIP